MQNLVVCWEFLKLFFSHSFSHITQRTESKQVKIFTKNDHQTLQTGMADVNKF